MDALERVRQWAACAEGAPVPQVDVRARVYATLREAGAAEAPALIDRPSLAFAGASLAFAAVVFANFLPAVRLLWDPWLAYMNAPWSF